MLNEKRMKKIKTVIVEETVKEYGWKQLDKDQMKELIELVNSKCSASIDKIINDTCCKAVYDVYNEFINAKGKERLPEFKELFFQWKKEIDKVMKENNADVLYSEHEFYDHLIIIVDFINDGKNFEDVFEDSTLETDEMLISYDIIDDLIEAMKDCGYEFVQYNDDDWLFPNKKVMFIDNTYLDYDGIIEF